MDAQEYFDKTSTAVKQLFDSIIYYRNLLSDDIPIFIENNARGSGAFPEREFEKWYSENKEKIQKYLENQRKYFSLSFSLATLSGSVLQISCMGISKYSTNSNIKKPIKKLLTDHTRQAKFCVGRDLRGIPIGLIILAARNQYNHWDDPKPRRFTINVFDKIATHSLKFKDPAFDLTNQKIKIYSNNILSLLEWNNYKSYITDMEKIINLK